MSAANGSMLDAVIAGMAAERPVFHSEADFQHSLAWHLKLADPASRIRLETRPVRGMRLDILVESRGRRAALELKYLVKRFHGNVGGEAFELPDQSAHDTSRYDVIKDIVRTESFVANGVADEGRTIVLTNDPAYWLPGRNPETIDAQFRIDEGRVLEGSLRWGDRAGAGTTRSREAVLTLSGTHICTWRDYSTVIDSAGREHLLRYLDLSVPGDGKPVAVPPPPATPSKVLREPPGALSGTTSARDAVLAAARRVAAASVDGTFSPGEVVAECRRQQCGYADSTIRTHVTAVMCVDAPQHHARVHADFERASAGRYRFRVPRD